MIRLLIADDHPVVRQGLKQILARDPQLVVVAEVANGSAVLEALRSETFDVLVLDISMPGMSGLEVLTRIRRERPELPVVILSMHPEAQYAARVLRLGASGYVTKTGAPKDLIEAIRKSASGRRYISPELAEKLAEDLANGADRPPVETLSPREQDVMLKIAAGQSGKEIAAGLGVSAKTVSTFRARILAKLGLRTTADLIRFVFRQQGTD